MYVDDLFIYATINNEEDYIKLQNKLDKLCKWPSDLCLSVNYDKYKVINFG